MDTDLIPVSPDPLNVWCDSVQVLIHLGIAYVAGDWRRGEPSSVQEPCYPSLSLRLGRLTEDLLDLSGNQELLEFGWQVICAIRDVQVA